MNESGEVSIVLSIRNPGRQRAIKVGTVINIGDRINLREGFDDKVLQEVMTLAQEQLSYILKNASFRKKNAS